MVDNDFIKKIYLFLLWLLLKVKIGIKSFWELRLIYKLLIVGFILAYFDSFRVRLFIILIKIVSLFF